MKKRDEDLVKYIVLPTLLALLVLWVLAGLFRAGDPDAELVQTTREVVQMALEAHRSVQRSRAFASVFRIIALIAGVVGPLVVGYLIYRVRSRAEVTPEEVLELLSARGWIDLSDAGRALPSAKLNRLLEGPDNDDE